MSTNIHFLLGLVVFSILLSIVPRKREHFGDVGETILTDKAQDSINLDNQERNNTPCVIKTRSGWNFEFKAEDRQLGWYEVPGKPNTCAIDLSGGDLNDNFENCSQQNTTLYNPQVVKSIYWNDSPDTKRCEIVFKDRPGEEEMEKYLENQNSYKTYTDCQQAFRDVSRLTQEKKQLQAQLAASIEREAAARRTIEEKNKQIQQLESKISTLEAEKAQLKQQLAQTQQRLQEALNALAAAQETIRQLNTLLIQTINQYEAQLLRERQRQAQMQLDHARALKDQHEADMRWANSALDAKDRTIASVQSNANQAWSQVNNLAGQLNSAQAEQQRLAREVQARNQQIAQMAPPPPVRVSPPLPPPPVTLYQHCDYGGHAIGLTPGRYTLRDLAARGMHNDDISSIRVPAGRTAHLYEHDNFQGRKWTHRSDNACFVWGGYNDIISSVIIE